MLTKITIRNFKRFEHVEIELGNPVVFIGPNDSGKTTALQALALWHTGLVRWNEKRVGKAAPEKRPGVTINRRDLIAVPVPDANLLWRDLHVRDVRRIGDKQETKNIRVEITVEGVSEGNAWTCGLEFDYANDESLYCRPLRCSDAANPERMPVPHEASLVRVAFLPPMSGLADREFLKQPGELNFLIGQGRTAEVLRNLCYRILDDERGAERWSSVRERIESLFGITLDPPVYVPERAEIVMTYRSRSKVRLDLSSSGRGFQQTLLLLAHMEINPESVLLLDEPDAHLEVLRQRQIYELLTEATRNRGSQIIAASHSEVVLNEAADRDVVVAFLGAPHRIDDRGSQVLKALKEIGFEQYYQAEQRGWVLYLEGSTDRAILQAFAQTLQHPAGDCLAKPFVHYVANQPQKAREHFFGLLEAKSDLLGIAIFDRITAPLVPHASLKECMWERREIESYLCQREVLVEWASREGNRRMGGPLLATLWTLTMESSIREIEDAMMKLGKGSPWGADTKVTDEFLDPLFATFFKRLDLPNLMTKTDYHILAACVPGERIDHEVSQVLDLIADVARRARPLGEDA